MIFCHFVDEAQNLTHKDVLKLYIIYKFKLYINLTHKYIMLYIYYNIKQCK